MAEELSIPLPTRRIVPGVSKPTVMDNYDGTKTVRMTKLREALLKTGRPNYIIGAQAGVHPYSLSLYVQGKKDMTYTHLRSLAKVLKCKPDDLLGWVEYLVDYDGNILPEAPGEPVGGNTGSGEVGR